ncbi:transcription factor atoh8 isoform X2 [Stegostoma tigrinum]|uniref:transcription factor atoh8 isoform X2 n=1 Tax=Stegostoma tigrinum TaxID=3053191 RepID=UPI00202B65ED|nr:transcription factor atoh8 isoform X2 [Stegostoma tigrinum]
MRTSESLNEAEWKRLCTIKRLKRKNRDVSRQGVILEKVYGGEEGRLGDALIARLSDSTDTLQTAAVSSAGTGCGAELLGLSRMVSPACMPSTTAAVGVGRRHDGELSPKSAAPARRKFPRPPTSQAGAAEPRAFTGQPSLQPRVLLCQRPADGCYSSLPPAAYSPSPRKRLGEPSGASTEIKAIQQTRRLLANARERTRVHTISAAFEALRKQVPCYSYGQKLSKLAILRIACNYILSLARLNDLDYSSDHSNMSFSECVEQCTKTLQAEGRSKKRKE